MTPQQAEVLEKVSDLLGEHFSAYTLALSVETDDESVASMYVHHGNYYEVFGLAHANIIAIREQLEDAD